MKRQWWRVSRQCRPLAPLNLQLTLLSAVLRHRSSCSDDEDQVPPSPKSELVAWNPDFNWSEPIRYFLDASCISVAVDVVDGPPAIDTDSVALAVVLDVGEGRRSNHGACD